MEYTSIRVDKEVRAKLDTMRGGKPYGQVIRNLLGLPEVKHNSPRRKRNRFVKAIKVLLKI